MQLAGAESQNRSTFGDLEGRTGFVSVILTKITISGFRRFEKSSSIVLNGKLLALIGPNETGKSSLLKALHDFSAGRLDAADRTRGTRHTPAVTLLFELESTDIASIDVREKELVRAVRWEVTPSGRTYSFFPKAPQRDLAPRIALRKWLNEYRRDRLRFALDENLANDLDDLQEVLESRESDLTEQELGSLKDFVSGLQEIALASPPEIAADSSLEEIQLAACHRRFEKVRADVADRLTRLRMHERATSPSQELETHLWDRCPKFALFGAEDRSLKYEYQLDELRDEVPRALANLASMAELRIEKYLEAADATDDTTRQRLEREANLKLQHAFTSRWSQAEIALELELARDRLSIFVRPIAGSDFARFDERSDGLRQFVALLSFIYAIGEDPPILLVDEVETHLHYDAQSDLIDVLLEQPYTRHVIYTTHSIGALPHDAASCCRAVKADGDQRSHVVSNLWGGEAGWQPILAAMGGAAMSFTPSRYSVICEGISDSMYLPALVAEASGTAIRYHVVPGLSSLSQAGSEMVGLSAAKVACLVDGDRPGIDLSTRLKSTVDLDPGRLLSLADYFGPGTVIEDLLDPESYCRAVNKELRFWSDNPDSLDVILPTDLPERNRPEAVKAWCLTAGCAPPSKIRVASRLLMARDEERTNWTSTMPFRVSAEAVLDQLCALSAAIDSIFFGSGHPNGKSQ